MRPLIGGLDGWIAAGLPVEAPVTTSLQGKSAFPETHPLSLGSGGRSISKQLHHFLTNADLIFGIGCSLASTNYGLNSSLLDMSAYERSTTRGLYLMVLSKADSSPATSRRASAESVDASKRARTGSSTWKAERTRAWNSASRPPRTRRRSKG